MQETARKPIAKPLPWQRAVWQDLAQRSAAGRLPHALLLTGIAGMGQRELAEAIAAALLCGEPAADGTACGACRACTLLRSGTHPDYLVVEPAEAGKRLTVDAVRAVAGFQSLKAQYGERRTIIVDPADAMNVNAANALLKTLEEPTAGTHLLLCSSRPASLLPTIRSRCQRIVLPPAHDGDAVAWLAAQLDGQGGDAGMLLAMTAGAPLAALALVADGGLERRAAAFDRFAAVGDAGAALGLAALWQQQDLDTLLRWLEEWLIDMLRLRQAPASARLSHADFTGRLKALAEPVDLHFLFSFADKARQFRRLAAGQANRQLLLEDLLLAWANRPAARASAELA